VANRRISELQELAGLDLADQDLFTVVHVSEVDPTLKNRKLTISGTKQYLNTYYLPRTGGTISGAVIVQGNLTVSGSTNFATATFTGAVTVGSLIAQSGATVSGTISGATVTGSNIQGTNVNGVLGNFTTLTGGELNFTTGNFLQRISGVTITGASGAFTSFTGQTITGTTVNVSSITGDAAKFTTLTGNTAGFTSITGATVTGTSGNFVSGVFTSRISGLTITGVSGAFTSLTGVTVTGTTANFATGTFSTSVSGITVTGTSGQFTTVTGISGGFTVITGATVTGTIANFVTLSGTTITGNAGQFTTLTGGNANFTNVTGVLLSGVTVRAATGVFSNLQFSSATVSGDLTVLGTGYFQSGVSVTGTISGITVTGTNGQFTTVTGVSGAFTVITGATVTGTTANFTTGNFSTLLSGVTVVATTGNYTSLTGTTTTGTTANFVTYNGASGVFTTFLSGATITGTTVIATTGNYTSLTGTTTTGTAANFTTVNGVSGVFTTFLSGGTVTGNAGQFTDVTGVRAGFGTVTGVTVTGTTANFVTLSGTTVTGTTANFVTLSGTTVTGQTANFTSGVFASGTAGAPSVSVGTTSNGFYSPGTNQLAISTSGTGRLYVDASGNVGIGTNLPSSQVDIKCAATSNNLLLGTTDIVSQEGGDIFFGGYLSTYFASIRGGLTASAANTTGFLAISTRNSTADSSLTERLRITATGNVGIGTTSPTAALYVVSQASTTWFTFRGTTAGYDYGTFLNSGASVIGYMGAGGSATTTGTSADFAIRAEANLLLNAGGNTERARIDSSGNVGIGGVPSAWLSTWKVIEFSNSNAIGSNGANIALSNNAYNNPSGWLYKTTAAAGLYQLNTGAHYWYTAPSGTAGNTISFTQAMTLDASGRLGIGTTSPGASYLLDVAGAGRFSGGNGYVSFGDNGYIRTDATNELRFQGGTSGTSFWKSGLSSESVRIDNSGRLLVGTSTSGTALLQVNAQASASGNAFRSSHRIADSGTGVTLTGQAAPYISYCNGLNAASNATAIAINGEDFAGGSTGVQLEFNYLKSSGAVASGDRLGRITFSGDDATNVTCAAIIESFVDGTPGTNDMPGRLVFSTTADGAASSTERMRIDSNGFASHTGSIGRGAPVTKTASFTLAITENWIICNGTATITVTLPAASSWTGREVMLKTIAAFTVVSASSNVVPLAGGAAGTAILAATAGKYATLVSDGTNWITMQAN